jgi:hypothetical protein
MADASVPEVRAPEDETPRPPALARQLGGARMVNCLLLERLESCAELCGIEGCELRADWKLTYQRSKYYVCDRHLNAAERSIQSQHTQLKGGPDGRC